VTAGRQSLTKTFISPTRPGPTRHYQFNQPLHSHWIKHLDEYRLLDHRVEDPDRRVVFVALQGWSRPYPGGAANHRVGGWCRGAGRAHGAGLEDCVLWLGRGQCRGARMGYVKQRRRCLCASTRLLSWAARGRLPTRVDRLRTQLAVAATPQRVRSPRRSSTRRCVGRRAAKWQRQHGAGRPGVVAELPEPAGARGV